ncbi:hypothetical protein V6Z11_D13G117600 [Gossypium hirsutum]
MAMKQRSFNDATPVCGRCAGVATTWGVVAREERGQLRRAATFAEACEGVVRRALGFLPHLPKTYCGPIGPISAVWAKLLGRLGHLGLV